MPRKKKVKKHDLLDEQQQQKKSPRKRINTHKIINNDFYSPEYDSRKANFKVSAESLYSSEDEELAYFNKELYSHIHDIVTSDRELKSFNTLNKKGFPKKLNKYDINKVYGKIMERIDPKYPKIEAWACIAGYFNVDSTKFYKSMSNKYKYELENELNERTGIIDKRKINRLF